MNASQSFRSIPLRCSASSATTNASATSILQVVHLRLCDLRLSFAATTALRSLNAVLVPSTPFSTFIFPFFLSFTDAFSFSVRSFVACSNCCCFSSLVPVALNLRPSTNGYWTSIRAGGLIQLRQRSPQDRELSPGRAPLLEVAAALSHRRVGAQQPGAGVRQAGEAGESAEGLPGSAEDRAGVRAGEKESQGNSVRSHPSASSTRLHFLPIPVRNSEKQFEKR